jgi:hypothetical protein
MLFEVGAEVNTKTVQGFAALFGHLERACKYFGIMLEKDADSGA